MGNTTYRDFMEANGVLIRQAKIKARNIDGHVSILKQIVLSVLFPEDSIITNSLNTFYFNFVFYLLKIV